MKDFHDKPFLRDVDRRKKSRRPARTPAWADPGGIAPVVDCVIVDVSEEGANVSAVDGSKLPDSFRLEVDTANALGEANVVWRKGNSVGVVLTKPKPKTS